MALRKRKAAIIEGDTVRMDVSTDMHPDVWATVDLACWPAVKEHRWSATKRANGLYVRWRDITLHRFLMKPPKGLVVDHLDGNPLNNSLSNLRVCTQGENNTSAANRRNPDRLRIRRIQVPTKKHRVRMRLADGTVKVYEYPSRAKTRTKTKVIR